MGYEEELSQRAEQESANTIKNLTDFWRDHGLDIIDRHKDKISKWPEKEVSYSLSLSELNDKLHTCSILILTANRVEASILIHHLYEENGKVPLTSVVADDCSYHFGTLAGLEVVHLQPQGMSSFTKHGASPSIEAALRRFRPKLVVSLGVAFGADAGTQNLGDVLVSDQLIPLGAYNKRVDGQIAIQHQEVYTTNSRLICAWKDLLAYPEFPGDTTESKPFHWYCGGIVSSGTVLSDASEKLRVMDAAANVGSHVIGGEMEGNGVYYACKDANIPCIVIKGICDWANQKNGWEVATKGTTSPGNDIIKDCVQAMAITNALLSFRHLLSYNIHLINDEAEAPLSTSAIMINAKFAKLKAYFSRSKKTIWALFFFVFVIYIIIISTFAIKEQSVLAEFINKHPIITGLAIGLIFPLLSFAVRQMWSRISRKHNFPKVKSIGGADLRVALLDFNNCQAFLQNRAGFPIYRVTASFWKEDDGVEIHKACAETVAPQNGAFLYYGADTLVSRICIYDISKLEEIDRIQIPDLLQVEYEFPNGQRFAHVITASQRGGYYEEKVFSIINGTALLLGTKKGIYNKQTARSLVSSTKG